MPDRRTPRTRAEYAGLFLPSIGAALTCSALYVALDLSLATGGALSGAAAVMAAIATCELDDPDLTGYRDRDLRRRDLRTSAFFVAGWALCTAVAALTRDRDPFDRFVAYYLGPPLFLAPAPGSPGRQSATARYAPPKVARTSAASPRSSSHSRCSRQQPPPSASERGSLRSSRASKQAARLKPSAADVRLPQPVVAAPSPTLRHERPR